MLKSFHVFLTELLNTVQSWEWLDTGATLYQALFSIEGRKYQVIFEHHSMSAGGRDDYWDLSFRLMGSGQKSYDITGTGNELAVFATVMDILKAFLKLRPAESVEFEAIESSRQKLYDRMMRTVTVPGYIVQRRPSSTGIALYVIRPLTGVTRS